MYDSACGVARTALQASGMATSATDLARATFSHNLAHAANAWALGSITMTRGANAGLARTMRGNTATGVTTIVPWPLPVASGDTFIVVPGCDKTRQTCAGRFKNLARFRGMPFIPVAETVT